MFGGGSPAAKEAPKLSVAARAKEIAERTPWGHLTESGDLDIAYAGTVLSQLAEYLEVKGTPREAEILHKIGTEYSDYKGGWHQHEQWIAGLKKLKEHAAFLKVDPEVIAAAEDMINSAPLWREAEQKA